MTPAPGPRCPRCRSGIPRLEWAVVACSFCGHLDWLQSATDDDIRRQLRQDAMRAPASVECWEPWCAADFVPLPGRLRVPGDPKPQVRLRVKKARVRPASAAPLLAACAGIAPVPQAGHHSLSG